MFGSTCGSGYHNITYMQRDVYPCGPHLLAGPALSVVARAAAVGASAADRRAVLVPEILT